MVRRGNPEAPPSTVFTHKEIEFLDRLETTTNRDKADNLDSYIIKVARLGGYLDRKNDPPPGAAIMWRGTARLADLLESFAMAQQGISTCG